MKKENLKIISACLTGLLVGSIGVVGANQVIQAIQNDQIKVSLNGNIQTFKDETTGEVQYPITFHDRTYLPLRNVAQLSGVDVNYDISTNTALLTSNNKYLGDNFESKYFWDYSSLNNYLERIDLDFVGDTKKLKSGSNINNMAASVVKKYPDISFHPEIIFSQLGYDGDSAGGVLRTSNIDKEDKVLLKYEKPLVYKAAAIHNSTDTVIDLLKNGKESIYYKNYEENKKDYESGKYTDIDIKYVQDMLRKYDDLILKMSNDDELKKLIKEEEKEQNASIDLLAYITAKYTNDFQFMPPQLADEDKMYSIDGIAIMNGNNTTIDNYYDNARVKKLKITINDDVYNINLDDTPEFQYIYLGWNSHEYTKPVTLSIEVLDKYDGRVSNDVYFSGISFNVDNNFVSFGI